MSNPLDDHDDQKLTPETTPDTCESIRALLDDYVDGELSTEQLTASCRRSN